MLKFLCKAKVTHHFIDCGAQPSTQIEKSFQNHISEFGYSYGTREEYNFRLARYMETQKKVEEINSNPSNTFTLGHNQFSTWTDDEFSKMLGEKDRINDYPDYLPCNYEPEDVEPIDWRKHSAVNPVQNQGHCGSCWTFSATATMEGAYAIKHGELKKFSEQQIVDCFNDNDGCQGGSGEDAMYWTKDYPLALETAYEYTGTNAQCRTDFEVEDDASVKSVGGVCNSGANDPEIIKKSLQYGPVKISVYVDQTYFKHYVSGIFNNELCAKDQHNSNHAIAAVGWDTDNGVDYFIIRNSWGTGWGEEGYIKIASTGGEGICLMNIKPFSADLV